jgi:PIN domain nuclease of toxin-antitoxin system
MTFLLDTQVLLWWFMQPKRIAPKTKRRLEDRQAVVWYSVVSLWEVEIKRTLGKLQAPGDLEEIAAVTGFSALNLTPEHTRGLRDLPSVHGDPFDRMLVAQARAEGLMLVTADELLLRYPVSILQA